MYIILYSSLFVNDSLLLLTYLFDTQPDRRHIYSFFSRAVGVTLFGHSFYQGGFRKERNPPKRSAVFSCDRLVEILRKAV